MLKASEARAAGPTLDHAISDYAAFLSRPAGLRNYPLEFARKFARVYPQLEAWTNAPLGERVGSSAVRRGTAFACIRARPYIYFLAATGRLELKWDWIFTVSDHRFLVSSLPQPVQAFSSRLGDQLSRLGYERGRERIERAIRLLYLRYGVGLVNIGERELKEFAQEVTALRGCRDLDVILGAPDVFGRLRSSLMGTLYSLHTALYHQHLVDRPPKRRSITPRKLKVKPALNDFIERYADARQALHSRPSTLERIRNAGRHLADWLSINDPELNSFADLTREQVLAYAASLSAAGVGVDTQLSRLSSLSVMFHDTTAWGWSDAPARPILGSRDLPKRPTRLPRFIPSEQLERLMAAMRRLECPYQRAALLIARWSGARRSEIARLEHDCLDAYIDGTARLRIPIGKNATERMVPLHQEAADAIRVLQAMDAPGRGFADDRTGRETRRLFARRGVCLSPYYLFQASLQSACEWAALLDDTGKATITAHRFRHTLGTELIEGGARVHTVMKMLGHTSTGMTLVYAHLSDASVREDYQKVLGPGALIAGPLAATLRSRAMPPDSLAWLKANFFRTELELGHCLRLPEEGPCECDLYLTCAKFVTTPEYAPRLRERRLREIALADDARVRGAGREAERHDCTRARIEQLLTDLGEALSAPRHSG